MSVSISSEINCYLIVALARYFSFVSAAGIVRNSYTVEEFEAKKNFPFGDVGLPVPSLLQLLHEKLEDSS